jgi:hypothetical protein
LLDLHSVPNVADILLATIPAVAFFFLQCRRGIVTERQSLKIVCQDVSTGTDPNWGQLQQFDLEDKLLAWYGDDS